ncbi:MAG TPA: biotin-dependent carboxyltransferase family protein [Gemmatimonadaceae bacterium]|nr:biotin-dependent carboxyltransferase family protein [Gemmatimonadaceae bacterium]
MSDTPTLVVDGALPFVTVQDLGRPGHRHLGVPAGGAMDRWALQAANILVGNEPGAAALEWAVGGGMVRLAREGTIALTGAGADAELDGAPVRPWEPLHVRAGGTLAIRGLRGAFLYVALAGGIDVPSLMGSRATYLPGGFGGHDGRRLRAGDVLPLGPAASPAPAGFACPPELCRAIAGPGDDAPLRVVRGPQAGLLDATAWQTLLEAPFHVAPAADRTGYRLLGPPLSLTAEAALPSEPGCPGAVQLPPGGQPIVLMADAPTVGGYPKPLVVCAADLGCLAQRRPGDAVRFIEIDVAAAQRAYRRRRVALWTLSQLVAAGRY